MKKIVKVREILKKSYFDQTCRCCLSQDSTTKNIFELVHDKIIFVDLFSSLLYTVKNSDDMPKNICDKCIGEIIRFYDFKKKAEKTERILSTIISTNTLKTSQNPKKTNLLHNTESSNHNPWKTFIEESPNDSEETLSAEEETVDNSEEENNGNEEQLQEENEEITDERVTDPKDDNIPDRTNLVQSNQFLNVTSELVYACSCLQNFTSLFEYQYHKKKAQHLGPTRYFCKVCSKSFNRTSYQNHVHIDSKEKQFQCRFCGKKFTSSSALHRHKMCHTGRKRYVCEFCGKSFIKGSSMREHVRIHTGEKPYLCERCGKTYSTSMGYYLHKRKHEQPENGTDYKCDVCEEVFRSKITLRTHYGKHSDRDYVCHVCGNKFLHKKALQKHYYRKHALEDPIMKILTAVQVHCNNGESGGSSGNLMDF